MREALILSVVSLLLAPTPVSSQSVQPATPAVPDSAILAALRARLSLEPRVRVQARLGPWVLSDPRLEGDSLFYRSARLLGGPARPPRLEPSLPLAEVSEIRVARGSNAGKGALIGGAVGTALGFLLVIGASAEESSGFYEPTTGEYVLGVAILGLVGTGVGALIGSGSTKWETVYPVRQARRSGGS